MVFEYSEKKKKKAKNLFTPMFCILCQKEAATGGGQQKFTKFTGKHIPESIF